MIANKEYTSQSLFYYVPTRENKKNKHISFRVAETDSHQRIQLAHIETGELLKVKVPYEQAWSHKTSDLHTTKLSLAATTSDLTKPDYTPSIPTQPASSQPASSQPASTKPASTHPASSQPFSSQPASTKPAST